jgi:bacteriorhodopsin
MISWFWIGFAGVVIASYYYVKSHLRKKKEQATDEALRFVARLESWYRR